MISATLPERGTDDWGSGAYKASRGDRTHKGIDWACYPGTVIHSGVSGRVTKLGYPYADDLSYRYVEITDENLSRHRYFYIEPVVEDGELIAMGNIIGTAQDIAKRYTKPDKIMINHVHLEILVEGKPVDPELYQL